MKVCLFDIDGTLVRTGGAGLLALEAALRDEFGAVAGTRRVQSTGRTDRAIVHEVFELHGIEQTAQNWQRFLAAYLQHLPRLLESCQGCVLPGITTLLENLSGQPDVAVGLLTGNSREGARQKLEYYRLDHHFAFGGFGDEHAERDDVARMALSAAGDHLDEAVSRQHIYVIGDTPLDVQCARAIDARAIAVATGTHSCDELRQAAPDLLVADFSDPQPLLQLWETDG